MLALKCKIRTSPNSCKLKHNFSTIYFVKFVVAQWIVWSTHILVFKLESRSLTTQNLKINLKIK